MPQNIQQCNKCVTTLIVSFTIPARALDIATTRLFTLQNVDNMRGYSSEYHCGDITVWFN